MRKPHRLLRLYPRAWRERYGEEFSALLAECPPGWREHLDIVRHAMGERVRDVVSQLVASPSPRVAVYGRQAAVMAGFGLLAWAIDASSRDAGAWLATRDVEVATMSRLAFVGVLLGSLRLTATFLVSYLRRFRPVPGIGVGRVETVAWCAILFLHASFGHAAGTANPSLVWSFILYLALVNRLSLGLKARLRTLRPPVDTLITLGLSRLEAREPRGD